MTAVLSVDAQRPDAATIARAAACLREGGLVAFPTETVYGLGVDALQPIAVRRLFDAKGRPVTDPLIVHVASLADVPALVASVPPEAELLAARFWPGPLTLVLPKSSRVPDEVTAGLPSVALRIPAHPVAQALLRASRVPVAAPSANLFSRPSPTRAAHVVADLQGRIDMVLDGGPTSVGLESTVVDLTGSIPRVLRPGGVSLESLAAVLGEVGVGGTPAADGSGPMLSPGMLERHYSPRTPLTLYEGDTASVEAAMRAAVDAARQAGRRVGLLVFDATVDWPVAATRRLDAAAGLEAAAADLYAALRELDTAGVDEIMAQGVLEVRGIGPAVRDRLRRAAAGRVVSCGGGVSD